MKIQKFKEQLKNSKRENETKKMSLRKLIFEQIDFQSTEEIWAVRELSGHGEPLVYTSFKPEIPKSLSDEIYAYKVPKSEYDLVSKGEEIISTNNKYKEWIKEIFQIDPDEEETGKTTTNDADNDADVEYAAEIKFGLKQCKIIANEFADELQKLGIETKIKRAQGVVLFYINTDAKINDRQFVSWLKKHKFVRAISDIYTHKLEIKSHNVTIKILVRKEQSDDEGIIIAVSMV